MVDPYPRNADETTEASIEDDKKVSDSEAMVDPYPGNADETTEANEDNEKVSNLNSEAAVDTYPGNADNDRIK